MTAPKPQRVERQQTDKGYVPVYTTAAVEQPWASYSSADHAIWATLFERQREVLKGRACREFIDNQQRFGMTPDAIPRFDELNEVLVKATGWTLIGVEGLLPELTFFEHLANRPPGGSANSNRSITSPNPICSMICSATCRCC